MDSVIAIGHTAILALDELHDDELEVNHSSTLTSSPKKLPMSMTRTASINSRRLDINQSSDRTLKSLSFRGSARLRGMRLGLLLRSLGSVLSSSQGDAKTYSLSEPVEQVHAFISHNWTVSRLDKFLALSLHFNLHLGLVCMVCIVVTVLVIFLLGLNPSVHFCLAWKLKEENQSMTCVSSYILVFPVVFLGRELSRIFGIDRTFIFLDKTCIDQQSEASKQNGIESLGAFIQQSESMIIPCTRAYFERLWTIYEIATFLALHPRHKLIILPTAMARCTLIQAAGWYTYFFLQVLETICHSKEDHWRFEFWGKMLAHAILIPFSCMMVSQSRSWIVEMSQMQERIQNFSIAKAACSVEADRTFVSENIIAFSRDMRLVPRSASDEAACEAFEAFVREEVPGAVEKCCGHWGLPYRYLVFMFAPLTMIGFDHLFIPSGPDWGFCVVCLSMNFLSMPLLFALSLLIIRTSVDQRGAEKSHCAAVVFTTLVVGSAGYGQYVGMALLRIEVAEGSIPAIIAFSASILAQGMICWRLFKPPPMVPNERVWSCLNAKLADSPIKRDDRV
eukprot:CAMPEP_0197626502 /NCGR_PEP_ID=MMETSP1338-20131121/5438_1 /TAXON_ID=43686 ORGANISM="Pelagodinium beii, Strain RCC1491" /NCGR_SAMPLE_ID=MMETSP1338 /ASSEMBLY_ACC=CAM_ASM_000754 /LENGTH=562 /DNA_ID=CAMNT_0043197043 /DNA_START=128 /DNA_END=1816 /DNA_ORIENTATION=+